MLVLVNHAGICFVYFILSNFAQQLDDLNINYDAQRNSLINLEKKQKKFDNVSNVSILLYI